MESKLYIKWSNDKILKISIYIINKRPLNGPWVAHLRMTVYKDIGKHSST